MPYNTFRYGKQPNLVIRIVVFFVWMVGNLFVLIFRIFFGWWLGPLLDISSERHFAQELRAEMPFLFERFGARVVRDPFPDANDSQQAYITLSAGNVLLKFSKWRSENYEIEVAPTYAPRDSRKLFDSVRGLNQAQKRMPEAASVSWKEWAKLLEPHLAEIQEAFKEENYAATKEKISEARRRDV